VQAELKYNISSESASETSGIAGVGVVLDVGGRVCEGLGYWRD
jgi:hypothetical protein